MLDAAPNARIEDWTDRSDFEVRFAPPLPKKRGEKKKDKKTNLPPEINGSFDFSSSAET